MLGVHFLSKHNAQCESKKIEMILLSISLPNIFKILSHLAVNKGIIKYLMRMKAVRPQDIAWFSLSKIP